MSSTEEGSSRPHHCCYSGLETLHRGRCETAHRLPRFQPSHPPVLCGDQVTAILSSTRHIRDVTKYDQWVRHADLENQQHAAMRTVIGQEREGSPQYHRVDEKHVPCASSSKLRLDRVERGGSDRSTNWLKQSKSPGEQSRVTVVRCWARKAWAGAREHTFRLGRRRGWRSHNTWAHLLINTTELYTSKCLKWQV